jgi:hypothetical protein
MLLWNYVGKQQFIFQHENIEDSNFKKNFLTAPIDLTLNYNRSSSTINSNKNNPKYNKMDKNNPEIVNILKTT